MNKKLTTPPFHLERQQKLSQGKFIYSDHWILYQEWGGGGIEAQVKKLREQIKKRHNMAQG